MKGKRSFKRNMRSNKSKDQAAKTVVSTDCEVDSGEDCSQNEQKSKSEAIPYTALWEETIAEENRLFLKKAGIIAISFLASVINFTRTAEFSEQQLYLECTLMTVIYFLNTFDVFGATAILLGAQFHWYLAFRTKSKILTVLVMTCLQIQSYGLRYYEWTQMSIHVIISCVIVHVIQVLKTQYVSVLISGLCFLYFNYVKDFGLYFEDVVFLSIFVTFAALYSTTGDIQNCYLIECWSTAVVWIFLKNTRIYTGFPGLGFKIF